MALTPRPNGLLPVALQAAVAAIMFCLGREASDFGRAFPRRRLRPAGRAE